VRKKDAATNPGRFIVARGLEGDPPASPLTTGLEASPGDEPDRHMLPPVLGLECEA